jgi:hypothetical protein
MSKDRVAAYSQRALEIDEETETKFWIDEIGKEITGTPAFEFLDKGIKAPF